MAKKNVTPPAKNTGAKKTETREVTQADLDKNPELVEAGLQVGDEFSFTPTEPVKATKKETVVSTMAKYGRHKVNLTFKFRVNEDTGEKEKYVSKMEKVSDRPLSTHNIEQHTADELNSQVEVSGYYYFKN